MATRLPYQKSIPNVEHPNKRKNAIKINDSDKKIDKFGMFSGWR